MTNLLNSLLSATEFWSAIAGSIVGGTIAFLVQMKSLGEARKQRASDAKAKHEALGNSLMFKVIRIHANLKASLDHCEESFREALSVDPEVKPGQAILPIANPPELVSFSADEMGLLLSLRDDKVFNQILPLDTMHNGLLRVWELYATKRGEIGSRLGAHEVEGNKITSIMTKEQFQGVRPLLIELEMLAAHLQAQSKHSADLSRSALHGLNKLLREKVGVEYRVAAGSDQS